MNPELEIWQKMNELVGLLRNRKLVFQGQPEGRLYAIAVTDIEKLLALVGYYIMPDVMHDEEVA